ncbi:MAG: UDP-N-acetylmuramoyl-tripeptide--D-alanyl-D-alanine ligase [Bacteroidales bacterium]
MEILTIIKLVTAVIVLVYLAIVVRRDMQMLQLNSYRNNRYMGWLKMNGDYTSIARLVDLAMVTFMVSTFGGGIEAYAIIAVVLLVKMIALLRKKYKKPLVFTRRVGRLYFTELVLTIAVAVGLSSLWGDCLENIVVLMLLAATFSCWVTMAANWLMKPVEASINRKFYNEAKGILSQMTAMRIVGITGSYGKTSTKHYLNRVLSEKYDVLMTPGSYNTPMGVIRTVREMLKPYHNLFIVEMGAKQVGDIKEICDLVNPEIGILTAVGEQHLESFKSIENVQSTKFELVDALPKGGFAVLNNDFEYVASREVKNVSAVRYGVANVDGVDYKVSNIEYSECGTKFTIVATDGKEIILETKLVGECNISNLVGAVIVALYLEVPESKIKYAVSRIEQVEHRLNLKRTPSGVTIIDDAFNSNPDGSRMALEVLGRMTGGKRIVITPGMIELGDKQFEYNRVLGEHIARNCDVAIVVGEYNRQAITEGIATVGMDTDMVHVVDNFNDAQAVLKSIAVSGDTVLYENDLPDTFK